MLFNIIYPLIKNKIILKLQINSKMNIKRFKPITPSLRHRKILSRKDLTTDKPFKPLLAKLKKNAGRNFRGKITVYHKGGGLKKHYRLITFNRDVQELLKIIHIEYDPNRHCFIGLTFDQINNCFKYIILPKGVSKGDILHTNKEADIKYGNTMEILNIPLGTLIHNVELKPYKGAKLSRSAGCYALIVKKDLNKNKAIIKLKSGLEYSLSLNCRASIGTVDGRAFKDTVKGKAGINRLLGIRPTVRGVAMNPVDHPHGGGEGRTSGGRPSVSPWGILTKGKPTVVKIHKKKKKVIN